MKILDHRGNEVRSAFDNPAVNLADAMPDWMGGQPLLSGVRVTESSAMTHAPVWQALNLVSGDPARMPLVVYRKGEQDRDRKRAKEHPVYRLLKTKPNRFMTPFQFKQTMFWRGRLHGNSYAVIFRDGRGVPRELVPFPQAMVNWKMIGGELFYSLSNEQGEYLANVPHEDIIHFRGMGDGIDGISMLNKMREVFGVGMAAQQYGAAFFGNSARPSVVLEHPGSFGRDEAAAKRVRESWNSIHQGTANAHKVAILEEGMKAARLSVTNEEAQFLQTREFAIRDVASAFNIPPHKLGDSAKSSRASLVEENQSYLDCLDPSLIAFEEELYAKLLTEDEQESGELYIEFMRESILRINPKTRYEMYNLGITGGFVLRSEAREKENLPWVDGLDQPIIPQNVALQVGDQIVPVNEPGDTSGGSTPDDGERAAFAALIESAARRELKKLKDRACKASADPERYGRFVDDLREKSRASVMEAFAAPAQVLAVRFRGEHWSCGDMADDLIESLYSYLAGPLEGRACELVSSVREAAAAALEAIPGVLAGRVKG